MLKVFLELNIRILLVILVFGLLTGLLRRYTFANISRKKHGGIILNIFNLVGTPVHELGHLFFAIIFGYKINAICLYRTLNQARLHNGTLGFVKMSHEKRGLVSIFQISVGQFFVGIGPLISGPFFILIFFHFLPASIKNLLASFSEGTSYVLRSLQKLNRVDIILLLLFLYVLIGISLNMELSKYDLEMAWKGLIFLEFLFVIIALVANFTNTNLTPYIMSLSKYIILISVVGIGCSLLTNLFSLIGSS